MGLRELVLQASYDSDEDDILNEFYIPALSKATSYLRLAGFFSSSALAIAARGIAQFIKNGGTMQLVVGAKLRKQDVDAIQKGILDQNQALTDLLIKDLDAMESEFVKDHVRALALMIANKKLDIKVVIPISTRPDDVVEFEGIYHMKVGLLSDGTDVISFSGSINESRTGWLKSIEEFKVFCSWLPGQETYVGKDKEKFEKYWNGLAKRAIIVDIPTAVKTKLLNMAPSNIDELHLERHYPTPKISLWKNQTDAIKEWMKNDFKGIFAMATGSGKTLAALSASSLADPSIVTVILVPTLPILNQWSRSEIPHFDPNATVISCGGTNDKWKTLLPLKLAEVRITNENTPYKQRLYIVSTMQSASRPAFLIAFKGMPPEKVQIISDEVHHMGAPQYQKCLDLPSIRRLGLSATPERGWDPVGTDAITSYFGPTIYEYSIQDAIRDKRLCHYNYYPFFAFLDPQEFFAFLEITEKINRELAKTQSKENKENKPATTNYLNRLLEERAKIKKKAKDKVRTFRLALEKTTKRPLIIFCEDTEQLTDIEAVVKSLGYSYLIYTSAMKSWEREKALDIFRKKEVELILAIRCLDEGLDVPECEGCIIVASSSSEREFVQRRGRILRGMKKKVAELNDIIVLPAETGEDEETQKVAETLVRQELERVRQLTRSSDNEWECRNIIRKELAKNGLESLADI